MLEAQLFGFRNTLLDARYGAHLAAEAYLAAHAPAVVNGRIDIRREHGGNDREVHGHVGDAQAAGDVEEDVFLHQLEADALFQYGQQHVQTALVETGGRALRGAVGSRRDEGLRLDKEGTYALDGRADGHP